jgi:hypothetical protein
MNLFSHDPSAPSYRAQSASMTLQELEGSMSSLSKKSSGRNMNGDERTNNKNRKAINSYLRHMSHRAGGKEFKLSTKGICYFQFKKFVIVIEVPYDSEVFFIYTMVLNLAPTDDRLAVLEACMQLNYMKQETRGSTLGIQDDEVNLCYSAPVNSLGRDAFEEALEEFLLVAQHVNHQLELAR